MLRHILFLIVALAFFSALSIAQPDFDHYPYEEPLSGTWATGWHRIHGVCQIQTSLRIEPGVWVDFMPYLGELGGIQIFSGATLNAGTADAQVVTFTSWQDPPGGGGNPARGDWQALIASGSSAENRANMNLTNCEIRYGGEPEGDPLTADGVIRCIHYGDVNIKGCYIHDNYGSGISTSGAWSPFYQYPNLLTADSNIIKNCDVGIKLSCRWYTDPNIKCNLIENCDIGMKVWAHSGTPITNNTIQNCYPYGVYCPDLGSVGYNGSWIGDFWNNVIDGSKYGIYMENFANYSTMIRNNIFANNEYGILAHTQTGYSMTVFYNCFYNNTQMHYNLPWVQSQNGIEDINPAFVGNVIGEYDYHLQWDSPCAGTGDPNMHNSNPTHCQSDRGAFGGDSAGVYYLGIIGGNVTGSLGECGSPYRVFQEFTVDQGQDLTIESGNEVQDSCKLMFEENTEIKVDGNLNISGNSVAPVILTWNEDTQSYWNGITMQVGSTSEINYAKIRYADVGIYATDAELTLNNSEIKLCGQLGIKAGFTEIWMGNNWVHNNEFCGLALCKASVKLYRNDISDNGTNGILAIDNSSIVADNTFPPDNQSAINTFQDNGVPDNAEVDLQYDSQVLFKNGHNNIIDNRAGQTFLMSASNYSVSYPPNNVTYNWWGTNESEELR
jgi:hypothetical protein